MFAIFVNLAHYTIKNKLSNMKLYGSSVIIDGINNKQNITQKINHEANKDTDSRLGSYLRVNPSLGP